MITLATTTLSLASVHTIWDTVTGQVSTVVMDVLPYMIPFMLLVGAVVMLWTHGRKYIGIVG